MRLNLAMNTWMQFIVKEKILITFTLNELRIQLT